MNQEIVKDPCYLPKSMPITGCEESNKTIQNAPDSTKHLAMEIIVDIKQIARHRREK